MNYSETAELVTVVVDEQGVILATVHRAGEPSGEAPTSMEIHPRQGQIVRAVPVPPELARLGLHERIDRIHDAYCLDPEGKLRPRAAEGGDRPGTA